MKRPRGCLVWLRGSLALLFVTAGMLHFAFPEVYVRIVPPGFPSPRVLVWMSGAAEIAGGIGLLIPRLRRAAGWGLIALLLAVLPVNVYMALGPESTGAGPIDSLLLWLRIPLQGVLIAGVWGSVREG